MYGIDVYIIRDKVHKNYICFIPLFCVGMYRGKLSAVIAQLMSKFL